MTKDDQWEKGAMTGIAGAGLIAGLDTAAEIGANEAQRRYWGAMAAGVPKLLALFWGYPLRFLAACFVIFWLLFVPLGYLFINVAWGFFFITGNPMMPLYTESYFKQHVNYTVERLYDSGYANNKTTTLTVALTNTTPYDIGEFQIDCQINYSNDDISHSGPTLIVLDGGEVPAHSTRTYSVTREQDGYGVMQSHSCNLHSVTPKQRRSWLPVGSR